MWRGHWESLTKTSGSKPGCCRAVLIVSFSLGSIFPYSGKKQFKINALEQWFSILSRRQSIQNKYR
jgi:hypothetical protein